MKILENISLAKYTTFKIGGNARFFCVVTSEDELVEAVKFAKEKNTDGHALPFLVLGGGSNMLVSDKGFNGLVIKMEMKNTVINDEDSIMSSSAGELWDSLVECSVNNGLYGLENLSAIPGTVGAAPVQNIGAYGAEVSQTLLDVRSLDTKSMTFVNFSNKDCKFGYRDSIFKHERDSKTGQPRYIITAVAFQLTRKGVLKMDYKDVKEYFEKNHVTGPTLSDLRKAIVEIRESKLPDWKVWGTAGSFFKNPSVPAAQFAELKNKFPDLPGFPENDGSVKVSLGYVLDKVCDAKGLMMGNVGTYDKQALVLIAKSGATAAEVYSLVDELKRRVKEKTGIVIEAEVDMIG